MTTEVHRMGSMRVMEATLSWKGRSMRQMMTKRLGGAVVCWLFLAGVFLALPMEVAAMSGSGGMVAYWKLDEQAGGTYDDLLDSNGENSGVCATACPEPSAGGKIGGSQVFDRNLSRGINVLGDAFNWEQGDSFSIELWMKKSSACSGTTSDSNEVLVGKDGKTTSLHWWVGLDCTSGGVPIFVLIDANGGVSVAAGTQPLTDGKWHHIAAVRDGGSGKTLLARARCCTWMARRLPRRRRCTRVISVKRMWG